MTRETKSDQIEPGFQIDAPRMQTSPVVFNSPHSGSDYGIEFQASSRLDLHNLRRSEDCFVDELFGTATALGAPLMKARFPRAWLDVNREPFELDPNMFHDPLPAHVNTASARVAGGLGTIPRIVSEGENIYLDTLSWPTPTAGFSTITCPITRHSETSWPAPSSDFRPPFW